MGLSWCGTGRVLSPNDSRPAHAVPAGWRPYANRGRRFARLLAAGRRPPLAAEEARPGADKLPAHSNEGLRSRHRVFSMILLTPGPGTPARPRAAAARAGGAAGRSGPGRPPAAAA